MSTRQKVKLKNQKDDIYDIASEDEIDDGQILNLSQHSLRKLPSKTAKSKGHLIGTLILTKNQLSSFQYFELFYALHTLQLDRNHITDEIIAKLPPLSSLKILWLNNNRLQNLSNVLSTLKRSCPSLEYLSLLFNPLCPYTNTSLHINSDDEKQSQLQFQNSSSDALKYKHEKYTRYKQQILSHLPKVQYLDIAPIRKGSDLDNHERASPSLDQLIFECIEIDRRSLQQSIICHALHLKRIIAHCPPLTHFGEWTRFYSTALNGLSKHTFFDILQGNDECNQALIVIQDTTRHLFGAYIEDTQHWRKSSNTYCGTFDSFVFHFGGTYKAQNEHLYIHRASGQQPYYLQCNDESMTVGCGGAPALYFDLEFNHGRTTHCKTFNSPPLTKTVETQFNIHTLEIWAPQSSRVRV